MVKREAVKVEEGFVKQEFVKKEESTPVKKEIVKKEEEKDDDCIITSVIERSVNPFDRSIFDATSLSSNMGASKSRIKASRADALNYRAYESARAANGRMKGKAKAKQNAIKKNCQKAAAKKRSSTNTQIKKNVKQETKEKKPSKVPSKPKKEIKDETKVEDVRGAIFRKAPSGKVKERVDRVNSQRMYLLDREREHETNDQQASSSSNVAPAIVAREEFKVLGSTGNVYTVTIDRQPRCDCPDWLKNGGDPCKHTLFVFLRVLGIHQNSHLWYQKALISSELQYIFANARPDPTYTNPSLQSAYLKAISSNKMKDEGDTKINDNCRIPQKGDVCPVCYEEFAEGISKDLVFCEESCGNPLHKKCAIEWSKACKRLSQDATCIYCRAQMIKKGEVTFSKEGDYLNMAGPSSLVDGKRDFSIYSWSSMRAMSRNGTVTEEEYQDYLLGYASGGNESDDDY